MENSIMTNWNPGKGDYIKRNAMEDSKRRKKNEIKTVLIVSTLIVSMVIMLIIVLNLFI
jgi:hypothetical protein